MPMGQNCYDKNSTGSRFPDLLIKLFLHMLLHTPRDLPYSCLLKSCKQNEWSFVAIEATGAYEISGKEKAPSD